MELISPQQRTELLWGGIPQEVRKLELRDTYEIDAGLVEAWLAGDPEGTVARTLEAHRDDLARKAADGRPYRRVRVVSEPLSEYQRMAVDIAIPEEQLRWLPRRSVSVVPLPGNDFFVLDDVVIFNVLDGNAGRAEIQLYRDAEVVKLCSDAFERAWDLATPNGEYKPA